MCHEKRFAKARIACKHQKPSKPGSARKNLCILFSVLIHNWFCWMNHAKNFWFDSTLEANHKRGSTIPTLDFQSFALGTSIHLFWTGVTNSPSQSKEPNDCKFYWLKINEVWDPERVNIGVQWRLTMTIYSCWRWNVLSVHHSVNSTVKYPLLISSFTW